MSNRFLRPRIKCSYLGEAVCKSLARAMQFFMRTRHADPAIFEHEGYAKVINRQWSGKGSPAFVVAGEESMHRFKRIVVATDLASESLGVVSYAAHLAREDDGELTIVHVAPAVSLADYRDLMPQEDLDQVDREFLEHARSTLEGWGRRHLKKVHSVDIVVEQGRIDEIICRVAKEVDADVVVIASHGREGISRLVLGSVAERVIREAPCPVLVVKPPKPAITLEPIEEERAPKAGGPKPEKNGAAAV